MIDTHCHIDDPVYTEHLSQVIQAQKDGHVEAIIVPGVNAASVQSVAEVCTQYPQYLYAAMGLHPEEIRDDWKEQLQPIKESLFAPNAHYVAIGEIGLDYHFDTTFKAEQHEALRQQMQWAEDLHLPVIIHSRDATEDTLTILREFPQVKGVFHCFSGSQETAQQIIQMGYYIGIGGVLTFKNCKLREHLSSIPLERIVLETDAPYMAPVPHRGEPNESRWISYVIAELAQIYNLPAETIDTITTANARQLFSI